MTRDVIIAAYLAVVVTAVAVQLAARRPGSRLPKVGEVFSRLETPRAGRIAVAVGWWWIGWHFFVR
jgi:Family of unknown function (DUF6186)